MKFLCIFLLLISPAAVAAQQIEWEVKDPFRLIDYEKSNSDYAIPNGQSALEFVTGRMSNGKREKLPPFDNTHWNQRAGLKRQGFSKDYIFPKTQKVTAWLTGGIVGKCVWNYQEQNKELDCSEQFEFDAITQFGNGDPTLTVKYFSSEKKLTSTIVVRDRLILGLGDSYASGEGNPDLPTKASADGLSRLAKANAKRITNGRWMKDAKKRWVESNAKWFDRQCHRSLFSQHVLTAMRLSSVNPKESLTLVPLACSGAEIMDGLLIPQKKPPGGGKRVSDSQLNLAVKYLCRENPLPVRSVFLRGESGGNRLHRVEQNTYRCKGEFRTPDAVLLSIGGNDVGFASAIAWAILPSGYRNPFGFIGVKLVQLVRKQVCPEGNINETRCVKNRPDANYRIKIWLPGYYESLVKELDETRLAQKGSGRVYLTAYPNPSFLEDGKTLCSEDRSADALEQVRTKLYSFLGPRKWTLEITGSEMKALNAGLIKPLFEEMKTTSEKYGWNFVDSHISKMITHGICSGFWRENQIPNFPHIREGKWYPVSPDQIWAYDTSRMRWFRNTNDSILFQTDGTGGDINGAFHPDFRAHALIADELFKDIKVDWESMKN